MVHDKQHTAPTLEELTAACKPGVPAEVRASLKLRLQNSSPADEAVLGAIKFLEDNDYNFDDLHQFLDVPFGLAGKGTSLTYNYKRVLAIAASIILALGIIWGVFYKNAAYEQIAEAAIYEPGLPVFATVGGQKDFHELMSAYRMHDAKAGLSYYNKLIKNDPKNDTLHYFGAWLYFMDKRPDSASVHFKKAATTIGGNYRYKALYMEAISIYLSDQKPLSKDLLKAIQNDKANPYQKEASILLAKAGLW